MTTSSEHAKNATAALHQVLHISPGDFDVEGTAAVIDQAIRNATRERDIRASQQLREAQAAAQERLAQLLSASPAVIYSFKATADFAPTFISDNITSVFGYTPAEYLADPSFWRDRVHPGDLVRVEEAISAFLHNGIHAVEYRFRHKDGSYRWVNDQQHLIRGVDGKPVEIVGSWSDITARKAAEEEKAAAHVRLNQLLMSSPAVIYSYRATGDFAPTFVSQNIKDWLGYEPREYLESADFWRRCVHPDEIAAVEAESGQLFKKGRHTVEEDVIALGEQLIADGGFGSAEDKQRYQQLLKNYQKLFRTTRRLMRLSDHNEHRLNAAADVIARKNKELEALSTKLSKYLSPQIYNSIFTGAQNVEIASSRKKLTIFFSDVVNFTEMTDKLELRSLPTCSTITLRRCRGLLCSTAPPSTNISVMPSWYSSAIRN